MWRLARTSDDDAITTMCRALNLEDPGPRPVPAEHVRRMKNRMMQLRLAR